MIEKEIAENQIILVLMSKVDYGVKIVEVTRDVSNKYSKICYVSFNKPHKSFFDSISKNGMDPARFYFIDTMTSSIGSPKPVDNCTFVSAPNALTELSVAFSKAMSEKECNSAIVDSLSALMVYEKAHSMIQFTHNIITKVRIANGSIIFISLKEDMASDLIKDLYMFVDKVVEI